MPNAFVHVELSTDDVGQAKKFYKSVFKWKLADQKMGPGMTYTMLDVGKGVGGGIQRKPMPDVPTAWLPYVEVDDVKKALSRVRAAGGQVVLDFHPIGEMGAIGVFVDPAGAMLGVWQTSQPARKPAKKPAAKKKR